MNASLSRPLPQRIRHVAVEEIAGTLSLTLFPRRPAIPRLAWLLANALTAVPMGVAGYSAKGIAWTLFLVILAQIAIGMSPYRARFRLSADGLLYDPTPRNDRRSFELALDDIDTFRAAVDGDRATAIVVASRSGPARIVRCFRMTAADAEAIAATLRRRVDELRAERRARDASDV